MRKEVKLWMSQAEKDLSNAQKVYEMEEYYLCAFLVHQSLEKALKALYIVKKNDFAERTHSLVFLGSALELPKDLLTNLRKVNPDFIYTRYPDLDGVAPYEAYDDSIAAERLKIGKEVFAWIEERIR